MTWSDHDILSDNSLLHHNCSFLDLCLGSSNFCFCLLTVLALGIGVKNERHFPEKKNSQKKMSQNSNENPNYKLDSQ
jgi:hypothetical protein